MNGLREFFAAQKRVGLTLGPIASRRTSLRFAALRRALVFGLSAKLIFGTVAGHEHGH